MFDDVRDYYALAGLRISDDDCDTFTREVTLTAGGTQYDAIYTVGYFMNKFSVYWTEHPDGLWNDPTQVSYLSLA